VAATRGQTVDGQASQRLEDLFKALAEPRRVAILRLVHARELPAGEIAKHFQTTRQAISQHLGVLATVGLVHLRRAGAQRLYRASDEGIDELRAYLDAFWDDSLLSLKLELAKEKGARAQH
jgi:DNA-binding transcriptional ArsR family regulator